LAAGKKPEVKSGRGFLARWLRMAPVVGPLVGFGAAYVFIPGLREEVDRVVGLLLREDLDGVRSYVLSFGAWSPVISLGLMVLQAVISPIPAFALSIANGLAFGAFWGAVISLAGRSLAASLCFYFARTIGRGAVESLVGERAARRSEGWLESWGVQAVLLTRLIPFFSFDLVSYAAGLSRLRFDRFLGATVIGEVPAAIMYSWVGARAPEYIWLLLLTNGVVFLVAVAIGYFLRRKRDK
jgi:uncharacterized membrane protein YdjX (TVP38/TMEM64 family)